MLTKQKNEKLSKLFSYILRHNPRQFGIILNDQGYCEISELLQAIMEDSKYSWVTKEHILEVVNTCEKQRYEIRGDMIRARYGHSALKVTYPEGEPPALLYHGTNQGVLTKIMNEGISKMDREYVHSSETTKFATLAGQRRGKLALITIDTALAREQKVKFYFAGNEVWHSDDIPANCLST